MTDLSSSLSSSLSVVVRRLEPSEADVLAFRALRLEALLAHPDALTASYDDESQRPYERWQERVAVREILGAFSAEGDLVGMMALARSVTNSKIAHLADLVGVYVQPAYRKSGTADALMDFTLDYAKGQGVEILRLAVGTHNAPAVRFYQRRGFVTSGTDHHAMKIGNRYIDEYRMEKVLPA